MSNPAIQQAIAELETNLRNLDSARTQVQKVTEQSEALIKSVNKVILRIDDLSGLFEKEQKNLSESLSKNLIKIGEKLDSTFGELTKGSITMSERQNFATKETIDELNVLKTSVINAKEAIESSQALAEIAEMKVVLKEVSSAQMLFQERLAGIQLSLSKNSEKSIKQGRAQHKTNLILFIIVYVMIIILIIQSLGIFPI
jgi:hypothetical protein